MSFVALMIVLGGLPDLPAPLGQLDQVLERPVKSAGPETVVELTLAGCDHAVPLNASRFIGGTTFALQQMTDWMRQAGVKVLTEAMLEEVSAGVRDGAFAEQKACKPMAKDVTAAPKLCAGKGANEAWWLAGGRPVAVVRWGPTVGKDKCLPRVTGVLFDAKGVARARYDADFGGAAAGAIVGDGCQVAFTFDAAKEVFHPALRGCKGK